MRRLFQQIAQTTAELRRRHVFRVAGVYAVAAWLVIQVAATTFPILELPAWTTRLVLVLALVGFPLALVLAWVYEITPDGVRRTEDAAAAGPPAPARSLVAALAGAGILVGLAGAYAGARAGAPGGAGRTEPSIAVLPFVNGSAEREAEYFSDGFTDDVVTRLARIDGLKVISRAAAMRYRGTEKPLPQVARELGVARLLTGRVQRSGNRVRISAELIDPRSGEELWRESYDRELNDIFTVQAEIAQEIARTLEIRLSPDERSRVVHNSTRDVAAYDAYLRARELLLRRSGGIIESRRNVLAAIALLRQALERDPGYARAYAGLSWAYSEHPDLPDAQRQDSSAKFLHRALRLDPNLPQGYLELGYLYQVRHDYAAARAQFERALRLDPGYGDALGGLVDYYRAVGRLDEALRYAKRWTAVEPGLGRSYELAAALYGALGDFDQEERWLRKSFEVDPDPAGMHCALAQFELSHRRNPQAADEHVRAMLSIDPESQRSAVCAGRVEVNRGHYPAAQRHFERYAALQKPDRQPWRELAQIALGTGDRARADSLLRLAEAQERARMREEGEKVPDGHMAMAIILSLRGDRDGALRFARQAVERGWLGYYAASVGSGRAYERLRSDPRFQRLMSGVKAELDRQGERVRREGI